MSSSVKFVPGRGNTRYPTFMIVGEAPGEEENKQGKPFVGRSGKLLDSWLKELCINDYYITNIVKVRPDENRTPTFEELMSWRPILMAEIDRIFPDIIITLGLSAAQALAQDEKISLKDIRGQVRSVKGCSYASVFIPTYHPSYVLRNRSAQEKVFDDFGEAIDYLNEYKQVQEENDRNG